jgi:uncharacterized alkaline shock family protein YloU
MTVPKRGTYYNVRRKYGYFAIDLYVNGKYHRMVVAQLTKKVATSVADELNTLATHCDSLENTLMEMTNTLMER